MNAIDRTQRTTTRDAAGDQPSFPDPSSALALAKQIQGRRLDSGTAALVAELVAQLGGVGEEPRANLTTTTLRLSTTDEFHYGFSENVEDIGDRLGKDSPARLTVQTHNRGDQFEMTLELSGTVEAVIEVQDAIARAAAGIVDVDWHP